MSLSNIIKACTGSQYRCFDFRDIAGTGSQTSGSDGRPKESARIPGSLPTLSGEQAVERLQGELQDRLLELDRRAREVEQEAYDKGFASGREEGARQGLAEVRTAAERLDTVFSEVCGLRAGLLRDYRDWLLTSSLRIARQIAQVELRLRPEAFSKIIEDAMDQADDQHALTFHLHPEDLKLLREQTDLNRLCAGGKTIVFREDSTLSRGGCRLESDIQLIDCSIETRLALVEAEMIKGLGALEDGSTATGN